MALVACPACSDIYDDTYYLTYCPHEWFEMQTTVVRGDGQSQVCTSIAEMQDFLEDRP